MPRVYRIRSIAFAFLLLAGTVACAAEAASPTVPESPVTESLARESPVPVIFRGRELLVVHAPIGDLSIADRARAIAKRLAEAFSREDLGSTSVRTENTASSTDLYLGSHFVLSVTDADAQMLGRTRRQLVADDRVSLERLVADDVRATSLRSLALSAVWCLVAVLVAAAAIWGFMTVLGRLHGALARLASTRVSVIRVGTLTLLSPEHALPVVTALVRALRWLVVAAIIIAAAEFVLNRFPWTRGIAAQTTNIAIGALSWAAGGIASFLPKLVYIAVIIVATRYLLKILHAILDQLGKSSTGKFPPEWVAPTYRITRFIVIALAIVVMFPYLPGSDSKAFQGVSVFVGILLSLGSTAAIANLIAGLVLIYMRALAPGDRVKVADTIGDVIHCGALAMTVRTIKNVDIAIPNSLILGNHVINFSRQAREGRLILHTTVTIGYGVDWRRVHELLIAAARETPDVSADPQPFVLQTSLDDFYVSYELNVYTREAQSMARIYSDMHARIQDAFNTAGVEIMSPHYTAARDGNRTTVPDRYLPKDYRAPTFGLSWLRGKPGSAAT